MAEGTAYSILTKFGLSVVDSLGKSLDHSKDATGNLRESIHFQIKILGEKMVFKLMLEDYYINVNDGRGVGKKLPPYEAISSWVDQKHLKVRTNTFTRNGIRKTKHISKIDAEHRENLIRGIQYAIKNRGIKPTHFYTKVVNKTLTDQLKSDLIKATKKDIQISIIEEVKVTK